MYDEPIVSYWHGATLDRAPSVSTRNDRLYDVSSAKLDALVDIARGTPVVIASRMTGAGFGDYTANLVWSDAVDRVRDRIEAEYPARSGCYPRVSIWSRRWRVRARRRHEARQEGADRRELVVVCPRMVVVCPRIGGSKCLTSVNLAVASRTISSGSSRDRARSLMPPW
jgi:hypothetical protein